MPMLQPLVAPSALIPTPEALASSFSALSPSQAAALAQLLIAALPEMPDAGPVPVATGQGFFDPDGYFVRAK
jgi:hypothetical protein